MRSLLLPVLLALPVLGRAEDPAPPAPPPAAGTPAPKVVYQKRTEINFEDETIDGDLKRPDGEYVEARRQVSHSNLIRIREDWREQVMRSAGDL